MAKPNYSFEKRQRELAKQKKQDEKRNKKQQTKDVADPDGGDREAPAQPRQD